MDIRKKNKIFIPFGILGVQSGSTSVLVVQKNNIIRIKQNKKNNKKSKK